DMHAISDSFDICKFNAFAEGVEEYVMQYNGMTGRDVTEDEMIEAGKRIYTLERYYNNLVGFEGEDDSLPGRFVEGDEEAIPGQGGAEGQLAELDQMKDEYYEGREWVDGVVPDERLDDLGIDVGPGTGVSSGGVSADD
ncbi:MAG: aldehyde ferredoxin oxidoreductase C-terminal domain-containing protein, partial [Halanaeroarchaeum sp.]